MISQSEMTWALDVRPPMDLFFSFSVHSLYKFEWTNFPAKIDNWYLYFMCHLLPCCLKWYTNFGIRLQYLGLYGPSRCHITTVVLSFWRTFWWHIQIFFEKFCPKHFLCNLPIFNFISEIQIAILRRGTTSVLPVLTTAKLLLIKQTSIFMGSDCSDWLQWGNSDLAAPFWLKFSQEVKF